MRLHAPAAERNADPILAVLRERLPARGLVLEISSGTGQHAAHLARALPELTFQPTEFDADKHASIVAWTEDLPNVRTPLQLDATADPWPCQQADAIFCANMIHIAPPQACTGLLHGASRVLDAGARLFVYGPFRIGGQHTAPSNEAFDASLKSRDPRWGVRDLDAVSQEAAAVGLTREEVVPMPANNQIVVFVRN